MGLLVRLAEEPGLRAYIEAMFAAKKINISEGRAVLHVALRAPSGTTIMHGGRDVIPDVHAVLLRMRDFATRLDDGVCLARPASAFATSSSLVSAGRTSVPSSHTKRCAITASGG